MAREISHPATRPPSLSGYDRETSVAAGDVVLSLDGVTKRYGETNAVDALSLEVTEGELFTLLGPSGCGKTTTLRMLAGLERPDGGEIRVAGERVAGGDGGFVAAEDRDVGLVFQDFALFPHLTARENIAFGLDDGHEPRVDELLDLVGLSAHADKKPNQLSGGQKQRVALARSLAPEPDVLLLDEPFSNLDVRLREEMRSEVRRILKETGVTAISVTHDQEEALSISDRVAVMNDGDVEQVGTPEKVFQHPESRFVASFLGQASFIRGRLAGSVVETGLGEYAAGLVEGLSTEYEDAVIDLLVRPDDLRASPVDDEGDADGTIVARQYTGPAFVYQIELDSGDVVHCLHNHVTDFDLNERVTVELVANHTLAWYPAD
jgi:iron(III) transport system ATP-binding protein